MQNTTYRGWCVSQDIYLKGMRKSPYKERVRQNSLQKIGPWESNNMYVFIPHFLREAFSNSDPLPASKNSLEAPVKCRADNPILFFHNMNHSLQLNICVTIC